MAPKRPHFTPAEISAQLTTIYAFSSAELNLETNSSLAPIIRNIALSRQQDAFCKQLDAFVKEKEAEIESVCKENYQDFVNSTEKLLKVRQGTVSLKHRVDQLNQDIQAKGGELSEQKRVLLDKRKVISNIDNAVETLQACLRLLDISHKIQNFIFEKKYFAALKSLDDLLIIHLRPLLHFPFAQHMSSQLPATRTVIRAAVTKDLQSWLFEARQANEKIGALALEYTSKKIAKWNERGKNLLKGLDQKTYEGRLPKINSPVEMGVNEKYEVNVLEHETINMDFRPLYQAVHIYTTLDAVEDLKKSYQQDRYEQAGLLLSSHPLAQPFAPVVLTQLAQAITGFFIIEAHVLQTTPGFRTAEQVALIWKLVSDRCAKGIEEILQGEDNLANLAFIKEEITNVAMTLEPYGYSISKLNSALSALLRIFANRSMAKTIMSFVQVIADDDYQPMRLHTPVEFEKVSNVCWFPDSGEWSEQELLQRGYPLDLPFTATYPTCCIDIRSFLAEIVKFFEGVSMPTQQTLKLAFNAADDVLVKGICDPITQGVKTSSHLPLLAQTVVNLEFFTCAVAGMPTLVQEAFHGAPLPSSPLRAVNAFQTLVKLSTVRIISLISSKLDVFFEDAQYPWQKLNTNRPKSLPPGGMTTQEPSGYLIDAVDYLGNAMDAMLFVLPKQRRKDVFHGALQHCADHLVTYFSESEPSKISEYGLSFFAADVKFLAALAANLPESGLEEVFTELTQMVALLESPNMTEFLDATIRSQKYNRINQRRIQSLFIKMLTFWNGEGSRAVDAKRKKAVEEVLKGLALSKISSPVGNRMSL